MDCLVVLVWHGEMVVGGKVEIVIRWIVFVMFLKEFWLFFDS